MMETVSSVFDEMRASLTGPAFWFVSSILFFFILAIIVSWIRDRRDDE